MITCKLPSSFAFSTCTCTTLFASTTTSISSFSNLYPFGAFVSFNVYFPGSNFLEITLPVLSVRNVSIFSPSLYTSNSASDNSFVLSFASTFTISNWPVAFSAIFLFNTSTVTVLLAATSTRTELDDSS